MKHIYIPFKVIAMIYFIAGILVIIFDLLLWDYLEEVNILFLVVAILFFLTASNLIWLKRKWKAKLNNSNNISVQDKIELIIQKTKKLSLIFMNIGIILIVVSIILPKDSSIMQQIWFISLIFGIVILIASLALFFRVKQTQERNKIK
jgi:hypothetical protein